MAINFAAANMAGYNNPEIEIITVFTDGETVTNITYNDIVKILSRGVFPVLSYNIDRDKYFLTPAGIEDDQILFSGVTIYKLSDVANVNVIGIVFKPSTPPTFLSKPIG